MCNFQPLEVVGRGSETQLQVAAKLNKLTQQDKVTSMLGQYNYIALLYEEKEGI